MFLFDRTVKARRVTKKEKKKKEKKNGQQYVSWSEDFKIWRGAVVGNHYIIQSRIAATTEENHCHVIPVPPA